MNPIENSFWRDRRVFVTGATGMVGYRLVKDLLASGACVTALVRDPDPQSGFYRSGDYRSTSLVQGNVEDFASLEPDVHNTPPAKFANSISTRPRRIAS
jgi:CDP-glucose 4,6-dehydratase